jgi:hypothetical protein
VQVRVPTDGGTGVAPLAGMRTPFSSEAVTYTARCIHCARLVFRRAYRLGDVQLDIIENHVLACRPLDPIERVEDLLGHFTITETVA